MNFRVNLIAIGCIIIFAACEKTVINHGYLVNPIEFKGVKVGQSVYDIYKKFGSPTMRSSIPAADGSFNWYYVSKRTEKNGFLSAEVKDQVNIVISFNKNGLVTSIKDSRYEKKIETVSDVTKTEGHMNGVFNETFAGMGKYLKRYVDKK